jgi:penicillin-binding protein 1A
MPHDFASARFLMFRSLSFSNFLLRALLIFSLITLSCVVIVIYYLESQLPSVEHLTTTPLQVPLRIYTADKKLIAEFGDKRRTPITLKNVPPLLIACILATEDHRFYEHSGIDPRGIFRAALRLIMHGTRQQGGSTITMQVARNFYLSSEKTFLRKINEMLLALKIEENFSKEQILELYLNKIYFGKRAYGVVAAAEVYYGLPLHRLHLAQYAMIAGLPQAPSVINPVINPEAAFKRRYHVLERLLEYDYISKEAFDEAVAFPIKTTVHASPIEVFAPHAAEMARLETITRFGENAYTDGYQVYTTLDSAMQKAAAQSLRSGLHAYDQRHGYRGPMKNTPAPFGDLRPAMVTGLHEHTIEILVDQQSAQINWPDFQWARPQNPNRSLGPLLKSPSDILKEGDWIYVERLSTHEGKIRYRLSQMPQANAGLVSLHTHSGRILALMGGYEFQNSQFNHVTQANRQTGSVFKPFIYTAALLDDFTTASVINDAPLIIDLPAQATWKPRNDSRQFYGPTRLRIGLAKSRNLVTIRLLQAVGLEKAIRILSRFGFTHLPPGLSLALGTGESTVLAMARGYAVFANGGYLVEPTLIDSILDREHNILYQSDPPPPARIIPGNIAFLVTSMLQDTIRIGTARRAQSLKRSDIAGKTGTTQNKRDAWYIGYTQDVATAVWVGFDDSRSLKEYGSQAALPIWVQFMKKVLRNTPEKHWPIPDGIVSADIDPHTGLLAVPGQENAITEFFTTDTVPVRITPHKEKEQSPPDHGVAVPLTPEESALLLNHEPTEDLF